MGPHGNHRRAVSNPPTAIVDLASPTKLGDRIESVFAGKSSPRRWWLALWCVLGIVGGGLMMIAMHDWLIDNGGSIGELTRADVAGSEKIVGTVDACRQGASAWCGGRWRASVAVLADYPFLIGIATLLALLIDATARSARRRRSETWTPRLALLSFVPFGFLAVDSTENAMLFPIIARDFSPWADWVTPVYWAKWISFAASVVALGVALAVTLVEPRWKGRRARGDGDDSATSSDRPWRRLGRLVPPKLRRTDPIT